MLTTIELLNRVKAAHALPSDYALAKKMGISPQAISRYRSGNGFFDARVSFVVAGLLGMNPAYVIACANMERAEYQEDEKSVSFWMHYALSENMTDNSAKKNAA
tara:strand:- start:295 stop:606 length:312 start_codon:yes stop_codon:yes gene_type:complete